jgi:FkbM family methyltransferase
MIENDLLANNPLWIVDVGARGGIHSRWEKFTSFYKGILFEPDPHEYDILKLKSGKNLIVINSGLSESPATLELHLCRSPGTSSIYKPNKMFLSKFSDVKRYDVMEMIGIKTDTLNSQLKKNDIYEVDSMKIDTQGYELSILKGSDDYLEKIICLELEVEFVQIYEKQPLFGDVDSFVRGYNFELFDIRRCFAKRKDCENTGSQKGQLFYGDALYFKSPEQVLLMDKISQEKIIRALCVYLAYGYLDLAQTLFSIADRKGLLNKEIREKAVLLISTYEKKYKSILPDFRGKGRIQLFFEKIGNFFSFGGGHAGTDPMLGNRPRGDSFLNIIFGRVWDWHHFLTLKRTIYV